MTVAQAWAAYQEAGYPLLRGVGHKRASTIERDVARYRLHVAPKLGAKAVGEIDTAAAQRWLDRIKNRGQRNQCLLLLKALLTFARTRGLAATNAIDIRSDPSRQVQTFLAAEQLRALGAACVALIAELPERMAGFVALRVLIACGARTTEILSAQRRHFDLAGATLWLPTHKGGNSGREVMLCPAAVADLAFARAGLERVRIHDLRHSLASTAVGDGISLYAVGELLGHRDVHSTKRYAHLSRDRKRAALDRVAAAINGGDDA